MKTHLATSNATPNPNDICAECGHIYDFHSYYKKNCLHTDCICQHFTQKQSDLGKEGDEKCNNPNAMEQSVSSPAPKANEQVGAKDLCDCEVLGGYCPIHPKPTPPKINEDEFEKVSAIISHLTWNNLIKGISSKENDSDRIARWHLEQVEQMKAENERLESENVAYALSLAQKDEALKEAAIALNQSEFVFNDMRKQKYTKCPDYPTGIAYINVVNALKSINSNLSTPTPTTAILKQFEGMKEDNTPITIDALTKLGFKAVESDMGSNYPDHYEIGCVNIWEFNGSGTWLFNPCGNIEMTTIRQLKSLCNLLKQPLQNPTKD